MSAEHVKNYEKSRCIFVFDIDGTLIDSSERARILAEEAGKLGDRIRDLLWSKEMMSLDKPRLQGIALLKDRVKKGITVIVSGRREKYRSHTLRQLKEAGIPLDKVHMILLRGDDDPRREEEWKASVIVELESELEGIVCEVHDNNEGVLELIRKLLPHACLVHHTGSTATFYRKTRLCGEI